MEFKPPIPNRVKSFDAPSVWLEFSPLAKITNAVNLGQGFPDWEPPKFLQDAAVSSIVGHKFSAYARSAGHPHLVRNISNYYSDKIDHKINPNEDVLVTVGASEALFLAIMSFIDKGDEVITIEPAFDVYYGALAMAEAVIKPVSLIPSKEVMTCSSEFILDWDNLEKQISSKTKALILNTPHNPTGKVFSKQELERLADLLESYPNCLVISDEVYENITFEGAKHIPFASIKNMYDRTISIYSSGKTFSVTGWKIGWAIGPKQLIRRMQLSQQWVVFSVSTPHQEAIGTALKLAQSSYKGHSSYYEYLIEIYTEKRTLLFNGLKNAGLNPVLPQGSFFILCDISKKEKSDPNIIEKIQILDKENSIMIDPLTFHKKDYSFCRSLSLNQHVTAIPTSAFSYKTNDHFGENWIRFAFCKENKVIEEAVKLIL